MHTGITTLVVAAILCRFYCKEISTKTSGYKRIFGTTNDSETIKGSFTGSYKNYGSINENVQDTECGTGNIHSIHCSPTASKDQHDYEDGNDLTVIQCSL